MHCSNQGNVVLRNFSQLIPHILSLCRSHSKFSACVAMPLSLLWMPLPHRLHPSIYSGLTVTVAVIFIVLIPVLSPLHFAFHFQGETHFDSTLNSSLPASRFGLSLSWEVIWNLKPAEVNACIGEIPLHKM